MQGTLQIIRMAGKLSIYTFVLITILFNTLIAEKAHSQAVLSVKEARISIDIDNANLTEALKIIEKNSDYHFAFKDSELKENNKVKINVHAVNQTFETLLLEISKQANVSFRQVNDRISVRNATEEDSSKKVQVIVDRIISGTITDENGEPLPGATVLEKGTSNGTISDVSGNFQMEVGEGAVLLVSFVGYTSKEVTVGSSSTINIQMFVDAEQLEEVVVIGYGTVKKSDMTGAVGSINSKDLKNFPVTSIDQAIQGRAAGVQVSSNTGQPGGGLTVRIRGVGTVNNNDPLYVIDGIPVFNDPTTLTSGSQQLQNPLALLNSNDIESIEILKDASATAIYGARANNGVVLITTKRGKSGELKVNFETYHGFSKLVNNIDLMNAQQWSGWYASTLRNSGRDTDANLPYLDGIAGDPDATTYDWLKEGTQLGRIENYQLSLTGGSDISKFYVAANYYNEEGAVINSGFKRYSLRLNTDHVLKSWLKVGNTLSVSRSDQLLGRTGIDNGAIMQNLMAIQPISPIYTTDGRYADPGPVADGLTHRIAQLKENKNALLANRVIGSLFADVTLFNGLDFHTSWSVDQIFSTQETFNPPYETDQGRGDVIPENASLSAINRNSFTWFNDEYFTYKKNIGGNHDINATLGYSAQLTSNKNWNGNVNNFVSANQPYLSSGINQGNVSGGESRNAIISYFARLNYTLNGKYILTSTVRRDGSSRFGVNNRFGTFPAVALGWRISEESFLSDNPVINNLKLRLSWGKSGGQEIGNYSAFNVLGTNYNYIFGNQIVGGTAPQSLANKSLQWEATEQTNIGADIGLMKGRLNLDINYFIKKTTNLLLPVTPAVEQGTVQNPYGNLGGIQNSGLELGITTVNFEGDFNWETNFNLTTIQNEVLSLANENEDRINNINIAHFDAPSFITRVGQSIGQFYIHEVDGIFQSWDEIYNSPLQNTPVDNNGNPTLPQTNTSGQTSPGDLKFKDVNNDGVINDDDRTIVGKIIPDFTFGITNTMSYKGIGLSVFIMGVQGVDVYNGVRASQERFNQASNQRISALDSWTPENPNTGIPRSILADPNQNNRASTRWLEDGSFVKIKNIRLSYTLPQPILNTLKISALQVYLNAVNAITFTKYTGFDPEIGNLNQNPEFGNLDGGQYPLSRQFTIGLKVGF